MLKASIIIPTYNSVNQLERALNSIVNINFDQNQFETIIVDNGSNDNTGFFVTNFIKQHSSHKIRYIYDAVPGLLSGRHRGAQESLSDILVFVDQDIYADENWLSSIVDTFMRFPDIHMIGGKCLPKYEKEPPLWLNYFWNTLKNGEKMLCELSLCDYGDKEKEIDPSFIFGLNFSIRKESLYALGGFHPDAIPPFQQYLQGDGETGLSYKAIEKGYKAFYQPKALVYHEVPSERMTLGYFDKRFFYQGISNSYSEIRKNKVITNLNSNTDIKKTIKNILRPFIRRFLPKSKLPIIHEIIFEKEMLLARFGAMERAGYNFHQEMTRKSPEVMEWVLKENYFDYNLPKI